MYDAINTSLLPQGADAYAGYTDGQWQTFPLLQRMFPTAHLLSIAVFPDDDADTLDIESQDAQPWQAPGWAERQHKRGAWRPGLYCSVSRVMTVLHYLGEHGISRSQVRLWSAHYTQQPHICGPSTCAYPGLSVECDATQWTDRALGLDVDRSLLRDDFFALPALPDLYTEDFDMHQALVPGSPVVFTRWAGAAAQNLPPFFTVESIVLTGDSGAQVVVVFLAGGTSLATKTYTLTAGEHQVVTPVAGTRTLRIARADGDADLVAAVDVFRR